MTLTPSRAKDSVMIRLTTPLYLRLSDVKGAYSVVVRRIISSPKARVDKPINILTLITISYFSSFTVTSLRSNNK